MKRLQRNNFAYLLGGLLSLFVLLPTLRLVVHTAFEAEVMRPVLLVLFSIFTMISVWSLSRNKKVFRVGMALAVLNSVISVGGLFWEAQLLELCASLSVIVFSVMSCYMAGRHVFSFRDTDTNSLIGAVCVYLLLGLIWALVYGVFAYIAPQGAFQNLAFDKAVSQFDTFLYFSFVTLTTAGYGDITPLNPLLRTIAYLEMIVGQFYMAILVSGLVAHFMGQRTPRQDA